MMTLPALDLTKMLPVTFTAPGLSEKEFLALAAEFPDAFMEYTADGTVTVMPPTDPESSGRVGEVYGQLWTWARGNKNGRIAGPDASFLLPSGARRGPDAAWYDAARWEAAKTPGTRIPVFAPEFVIEVRSPEQRARPLREKMDEYMANGVQLGWLIDPIDHTVTIYRRGRDPEVLDNPPSVAGEGPVEGFVLNLDRIL